MKRLIDLSNEEARTHFLKGSSYFNGDLPKYISFEPVLNDVSAVLNGDSYAQFKNANPNELPNVNYNLALLLSEWVNEARETAFLGDRGVNSAFYGA